MGLEIQELTGGVIAAAIAVHKELKPGLDEKLYERALCIELAERGIHFDQQKTYSASYKGKHIGNLIPDLIIENRLVVEAKCAESFSSAHDAQMIGYLNITGLDVGLILNFKSWPLGKRRILRPGFTLKQSPWPPFSPSLRGRNKPATHKPTPTLQSLP